MKLYLCRGKRQANYFLEHNCRLIRIDTDQKSNGFLVFIFEWDENLDNTLQLWKVDKDTYLIS